MRCAPCRSRKRNKKNKSGGNFSKFPPLFAWRRRKLNRAQTCRDRRPRRSAPTKAKRTVEDADPYRMAGILCIARNLHRRGDHRSPAFVAQSKIASLVQREVVPNGTGGIVTEQKRLKEYGTTPQALTRQLPLHRGAEPRANHDKRTAPDAGPYRIKTYAHPVKQNSPPFFKVL